MSKTTMQKKKTPPKQAGDKQPNENPRGVYRGTRESWLARAAVILAVLMNETRAGLEKVRRDAVDKCKPSQMAFACGFLTPGAPGCAIAECSYKHGTKNGKHEIKIMPTIGGKRIKAESIRVLDILMHEMLHTMCIGHGHRGQFPAMCRALGLVGRPTSTIAGKDLQQWLKVNVVDVLGKFPHKAVAFTPRGKRGKGSRLLKIVCTECDIIMRASNMVCEKVANGPCPSCANDMSGEIGVLELV